MRLRRLIPIGLPVVGVGLTAGLVFGWPWSRDMVEQPAVRPFEVPMPLPPEGTVPQPWAWHRGPTAVMPEAVETGRRLFETYCIVCHGPDAKGTGPVAKKLKSRPYDITGSFVARKRDASLYETVRGGGVVMPPYREVLSPPETWAVLSYIRSLQRRP